MKTLLTTLIALHLIGFARADETLIAEFPANELGKTASQVTSVVVLADGQPALKIENPGPAPLHATLLTVEAPKITQRSYALSGVVRTEEIQGGGYLEMWSHFGEKEAYFSRTLAASGSGPMGKLQSNEDWRPFALPFDVSGADSALHQAVFNKLVFNIHLEGKGTVFLRGVKLTQSGSLSGLAQRSGAWWSDRKAGLIGGLGGALVGCLGGLIEWLASRRQAEGFVVNSCKGLVALGVAATAAGLVALGMKQPYAVWYPLTLLGILCAGIFPFRQRRYQQIYRESELRRMSSLDLSVR